MLYGAAEFSRDADFAILADRANLDRLRAALDELQASVIAVPPFEERFLHLGLAIHFRCRDPLAERVRIDVMSRMRGVEPFHRLWERRTTVELGGLEVELLALQDLIAAKKTQRSKDWPVIQRLVEVNYFQHREARTSEQVRFWLRELRTPELLVELAAVESEACARETPARPLLALCSAETRELRDALHDELRREQEADRAYWAPLKRTLAELRRARN